MDFLKTAFDPPVHDATVHQKIALAKRLAEVIERNRRGTVEEKMLKEQIAILFQPQERVERVTRKVIKRFTVTKDLEHYLKEHGLWRVVTRREDKVVKDRIIALSEDDDELAKLYEAALVPQDRIDLGPASESI